MDTRLKYRDIIKSVLQKHADYRATLPDGYNSQVLFDIEPLLLTVFHPTTKLSGVLATLDISPDSYSGSLPGELDKGQDMQKLKNLFSSRPWHLCAKGAR
ncbi:MAG: hypothetical protein VKL59_00075 [Nostocaceae cyanobacterium]|nr:hypothetical protein [Nostocaceae cyanobacterium]